MSLQCKSPYKKVNIESTNIGSLKPAIAFYIYLQKEKYGYGKQTQ